MSLPADRRSPGVPPGFTPYKRGSAFRDHAVGPMFEARQGTAWRLGVRVAERHLNSNGRAHGGLLSTLADVALGHAITVADPGARPTTVSLGVDYLRSPPFGSWLELRPTVLRVGHRLAFSRADIYADDELVGHAAGTFAVSRGDGSPVAPADDS